MNEDDTALGRLSAKAGVGFPHLTEARRRTRTKLIEREERVQSLAIHPDVSIVLMGSWGRSEVTSGSDDDYMVLVNGTWRPEHEVDPQIDDVAERFDKPPGREGVFGEVAYSDFLIKRIGLQEDDNKNLTRRMLLMLESLPLANPQQHAEAKQAVIDGYLREAAKDRSVPRFLLNDVVRYWRTVGVDFAGKQRKRRGEGWGLRNAKLRTTRKVLFAGGLIPVLRCADLELSKMPEFLGEQFSLPPTDRIADAFLTFDLAAEGAASLAAYDDFIGKLNDKEFRDALDELTREESDASDEFKAARCLGDALEEGLLALLFQTALAEPAKRFGIF